MKWVSKIGLVGACSILVLLSFSASLYASAYQQAQGPDEPDVIFSSDRNTTATTTATATAPTDSVPLSNRIVDYGIDVTFDPASRTLVGSEQVDWRNPGSLPVDQLYFHLYPNAFESPNTTFMREQREQNGERPNVKGDMRLDALTLADMYRRDLLSAAQYVQPDDGNPDDRTLLRVDLPDAVPPGQDVKLLLRFRVDLPNVYRRMGAADDFVMAAQWFPKLAVYEPQGTRGRSDEGWNLHQYHANSEFYADFGTYDVAIHVPLRYQVAATGALYESTESGNARVYRFAGDDIHDFAWAASSGFQYTAVRMKPRPDSSEVKIKLYTDARSSPYRDRYLAAAKKALAHYAEWFGPYPYPTLTIVVPPAAAAKAGSMEYPTLVTAKAVLPNETPDLTLERVVMHELAHQYFYGMVANNEFEEAWLDEAFAVYAEDRAMQTDYNQPRGRLPAGQVKTVVQNSWLYPSRADYEDAVYFRGKMALDGLAFRLGQPVLDHVLRTYFTRFRFRHPSTMDFVSVLEEVSGENWHDFAREWLYGGHPPAQIAESSTERVVDGGALASAAASPEGASPEITPPEGPSPADAEAVASAPAETNPPAPGLASADPDSADDEALTEIPTSEA